MFWAYIRLARSLSVLQHIVIFLTTLTIPVSFELVQGWQSTGLCLLCVDLGKFALYAVWYQIAMLVIASATRQDRARVEARLDQILSQLAESTGHIEEESQRQITGIQDRVSDLRSWVQNIDRAMRDELGVDLPSPRISLRANAHAEVTMVSNVCLTVSGPVSRMARFSRWVQHQAWHIKRWVRKIFVDWRDGSEESRPS